MKGYTWATQWSLPSDELPKLLVPSYCGYDSWHASAPYWGRMGRSEGWEASKQGFRNFTQTNEYLGASVLLLALIGLTGGCLRLARKKRQKEGGRSDDVAFWSVLGLISLIMALGKYGFLYRLFYELPMMSSIRNPVKFMHLVSLAVSVLCAHGVEDILLIVENEIRRRRWCMVVYRHTIEHRDGDCCDGTRHNVIRQLRPRPGPRSSG